MISLLRGCVCSVRSALCLESWWGKDLWRSVEISSSHGHTEAERSLAANQKYNLMHISIQLLERNAAKKKENPWAPPHTNHEITPRMPSASDQS
ncbi:hypothetical protein TIFTF001_016268 [Ficus carica]|uniref:Uncharacterized protein n=1 Tax=Ficus carica TaxID=3494 RepID=A0AA88AJA7_FICCA|nr:hypothetical protein TIFTF001_016268 [Ficus carica]